MEERFLTIVDFWKILKNRFKRIIIFVFIIGIISVIISLLLPNWYKANAVILPPHSEMGGINASIMSTIGIPGILGGTEDYSRYIAILKSRSLMTQVVNRFNLQDKYNKEKFEDAISALRDNMEIVVGEEMQIIVSVYDKDQNMVADMANYIVYCLDSINIALSIESAKNNRQFIQSRLTEVLDSLKTMEINLAKFMKTKGILSLPDQIKVGVEKAAELKANLTYKEIELEVAEKTLGENSPKVRQMRYELESLKKKYNEYISGVDELMPRFDEVPRLAIDMERIKRQIEYFGRLMEFLGPQYEQARIEETKTIPTIQILDYPVKPEKKAKPHRMIIVLLSCFVGGFIIYLYYLVKDGNRFIKE